ncbi:hypothetical protein AB4403_18375, partial [Vibrio breoganii]
DEYIDVRGSIKCWFHSSGEKLGTHAVTLLCWLFLERYVLVFYGLSYGEDGGYFILSPPS